MQKLNVQKALEIHYLLFRLFTIERPGLDKEIRPVDAHILIFFEEYTNRKI